MPTEVRKTVTVVFADVAGSTGLGERLDPESLRRIMERYFDEMRAAVERHEGTVEKFIGDAVMAVFGIPRVHEDDALRAVRAAAEMQERIDALNGELEREWGVRLELRIGLNTGEVLAGDPAAGASFATGDAVNVAARLQQAAEPGGILLGDATFRLVRDAVEVDDAEELRLRGKRDPAGARRLRAVRPGMPGRSRRLDTPLIGRRRELDLLQEAYERTTRERRCRLFTVLGPAGIGKSRLVEEFVSLLPAAVRIGQGRCLPYGQGITYWPVAEAVKGLAGIRADDSGEEAQARLAGLLDGIDDAELVATKVAAAFGLATGHAATEEASWAIRRLFEVLARERPLVIVFDDLQWGEETFLDLLEHLADASEDGAVLVVCLARPELVELRPAWPASVVLEPLAGEESSLLAERLLGAGELDAQARTRLLERAGGNPLFVEELVAMLLEGGADTVAIPGTIHALLAARLDQLPMEERRVVEVGAIEGEVFHEQAVAALLGDADLDPPLRELMRKELVRLDNGGAYRFGHLLIRDAAYSAIPKGTRADLHRRFADWLERSAGARIAEQEEILGYHLEQAFRYHADLGRRTDQAAAETAARAARRLGSAGLRAATRGDVPAATKLLDRAVGLLPEEDPGRADLELTLGWAFTQSGDFAAAEELFAAVVARAAARGDRRSELRGLVEKLDVGLILRPEGGAAEVLRLADDVVPELEALGDDGGLARAWRVIAYGHNMRARYGPAADALERGLAHAERAGDAAVRSDILAWLPTRLFRGPMPAERALERCRELLAQAAGDRPAEAGALAAIALLEAITGRLVEARAAERKSRAIKEELGLRLMVAIGDIWRGEFELLVREAGPAEEAFRAATEFLGEHGDRNFYSTAAVGLARALFLQKRYDASWEVLRAAEEAMASDDFITVVWALGARGRLLAVDGRLDEAREACERGVRLAFETDDLDLQADALLELAEVAEGARAAAALEQAVEVAERKGNVVVARQARESLATRQPA